MTDDFPVRRFSEVLNRIAGGVNDYLHPVIDNRQKMET